MYVSVLRVDTHDDERSQYKVYVKVYVKNKTQPSDADGQKVAAKTTQVFVDALIRDDIFDCIKICCVSDASNRRN